VPDAKVGVNVPVLKAKLISLRWHLKSALATYPGSVTGIRFCCFHPERYNRVMVFTPTVKFMPPEALPLVTAVPFYRNRCILRSLVGVTSVLVFALLTDAV